MNVALNTVLRTTQVEAVKRPVRLVSNNVGSKATFENVAVVGLGYVGLPLAICLADEFERVAGFDISRQRVAEINNGFDSTSEIDTLKLQTTGLRSTTDVNDLSEATFFIVTVPTPITDTKQPDLAPLRSACNMIGPNLKKGDVVVFESTVYPGVTEDFCGPLLERASGLKASKDFGLGYSAERINPGDKVNTVRNVVKVVSGDTPKTLKRVKAVYGLVIGAGLHVAPNIKVAEAAKVLENTQRDINIALMNEMSLICDKIGINTRDVIDAAATKWNFMPFTPGLVGGHCIGVDPYYLASLADKIGHHPQVILAGRRTNDGMVRHVADATLRSLIKQGGDLRKKRVGFCGITFKENVPDIRNSKSLELVEALRGYGIETLVHDPYCTSDVAHSVGIDLCSHKDLVDLDALIIATPHSVYSENPVFLKCVRRGGVLIDIKGAFRNSEEIRGLNYWSL